MKNLLFVLIIAVLCASCNETKPNNDMPSIEYKEACEIPETVIFGYKGRIKAVIKNSVTKNKVDDKWVTDATNTLGISRFFYNENGYPTKNESEFSDGSKPEVIKNVFEYINGKVSTVKTFINDSLVKTSIVACKGRYQYETTDMNEDSSKRQIFLDKDNRIIKEVMDLAINGPSRVRYEDVTTYGIDVDTIRSFKDGTLGGISFYKILKRDRYGNPIETMTESGDIGTFTNIIYEYYK